MTFEVLLKGWRLGWEAITMVKATLIGSKKVWSWMELALQFLVGPYKLTIFESPSIELKLALEVLSEGWKLAFEFIPEVEGRLIGSVKVGS